MSRQCPLASRDGLRGGGFQSLTVIQKTATTTRTFLRPMALSSRRSTASAELRFRAANGSRRSRAEHRAAARTSVDRSGRASHLHGRTASSGPVPTGKCDQSASDNEGLTWGHFPTSGLLRGSISGPENKALEVRPCWSLHAGHRVCQLGDI